MSKLLVIEDEDSVRLPLVDLLRIEGFEVLEASNGEAGVKIALQESPDLILCDVTMPRLDGFQVLQVLRGESDMVLTPFIFLTARIESKDAAMGLNLGADDYINKPFDPAQLIQRIRSRLEKYKLMKESLNQVRSKLIGKVPHEFKTPLNGILGFASMMKENALLLNPAEVRDFSALILESGERMLQTVQNYVRFLELQIEQGQPEVLHKYSGAECFVDLTVLDSLFKRIVSRYRQREGDLDFFVLPARLAVPEKDLSFMVYQLLDNALKFSGPNTRVNLNTLIDSSFYIISVADRGLGMNEAQVAGLGPFVQFNREEKEQQGLGLGLSIVESLCHNYGGSLSINSQSGEGTRVILRLPIFNEGSA